MISLNVSRKETLLSQPFTAFFAFPLGVVGARVTVMDVALQTGIGDSVYPFIAVGAGLT